MDGCEVDAKDRYQYRALGRRKMLKLTPVRVSQLAERILVAGACTRERLVDELRLTVFPVALGAGERLFGETSDTRPLRLVDTRTIGSGLAHLTYERVREA